MATLLRRPDDPHRQAGRRQLRRCLGPLSRRPANSKRCRFITERRKNPSGTNEGIDRSGYYGRKTHHSTPNRSITPNPPPLPPSPPTRPHHPSMTPKFGQIWSQTAVLTASGQPPDARTTTEVQGGRHRGPVRTLRGSVQYRTVPAQGILARRRRSQPGFSRRTGRQRGEAPSGPHAGRQGFPGSLSGLTRARVPGPRRHGSEQFRWPWPGQSDQRANDGKRDWISWPRHGKRMRPTGAVPQLDGMFRGNAYSP